MSQRAVLLEVHATTHIESSEFTLVQAEQLWAGDTVVQARSDDVRELLNYRDALGSFLITESGEPINESLIREIHKRLIDGLRHMRHRLHAAATRRGAPFDA